MWKECTKCNKIKSFLKFSKKKKGEFGLQPVCKKCSKILGEIWRKENPNYQNKWYKKNRKEIIKKTTEYHKNNRSKRKDYYLRYNYNITLEEQKNILKKQNYKCAICEKKFTKERRSCIDHCHETSLIRGLLCDKCNRGLGHFNDDINLLEKALKYLRRK